MALKYDPTKDPHAFYCTGPSQTEAEHADSCDINKMIKNALRGAQIRGNPAQPVYGYDDTNMDALTMRIQKQKLEDSLTEAAKTTELSEEESMYIPESTKKRFGFKVKKKNDEKNKTNDEKPSPQPTANVAPEQKTENSTQKN